MSTMPQRSTREILQVAREAFRACATWVVIAPPATPPRVLSWSGEIQDAGALVSELGVLEQSLVLTREDADFSRWLEALEPDCAAAITHIAMERLAIDPALGSAALVAVSQHPIPPALLEGMCHPIQARIEARLRGAADDTSPEHDAAMSGALSQYAVDHANDAIFWLDAEGTIVYANYAAAFELGVKQSELKGRNYAEVNLTVDADEWDEVWEDLAEAMGIRFESWHTRAGGEDFPVEVSISKIFFKDRPYACVFTRDIAQRKQVDEEFRAYAERLQQSNRELEDFAYVASHDLQEPLRKIQAFGDRIARRYADVMDERGLDYLDRMLRAATRMSRLIDDLLRFSRVTTHAEPFERVGLEVLVSEILEDLIIRLQESEGEVVIEGELPEIEADRTQMRQVFQNLISNALKFSRPGHPPRVVIRAVAQEPDPDTLPLSAEGADRVWYHFTVEDNGIGFESKYADKIFSPFQRLHGRTSGYTGTGIGLAIVRKIVERHGGSIQAEGRPGQGATFSFKLPNDQPRLLLT